MVHKQKPEIGNARSLVNTNNSGPVQKLLQMMGLSRNDREHDHDVDRASTLKSENEHLREQIETISARESNARYLATHDGLTGLANRNLLMDRYIQAAAHAHRGERSVALLMFDIDGFKHVNDTYGHLVGDRLLQRIAGELEALARAGDTACRYGGDEFMLLLGSVNNISDAEQVAHKVAIRIVDALHEEGIELDVTASCGIAMYPEHGKSWHALMRAADHAMYRHKHVGEHADPSTIAVRSDEDGSERAMPTIEPGTRHARASETPLHHEPGFAGGDGAGIPPRPRAGES